MVGRAGQHRLRAGLPVGSGTEQGEVSSLAVAGSGSAPVGRLLRLYVEREFIDWRIIRVLRASLSLLGERMKESGEILDAGSRRVWCAARQPRGDARAPRASSTKKRSMQMRCRSVFKYSEAGKNFTFSKERIEAQRRVEEA